MKKLVLTLALAASASFAATVDRNEMGNCGYAGADDFWDASLRDAATVDVTEGAGATVVTYPEYRLFSAGIDLTTWPFGLLLFFR